MLHKLTKHAGKIVFKGFCLEIDALIIKKYFVFIHGAQEMLKYFNYIFFFPIDNCGCERYSKVFCGLFFVVFLFFGVNSFGSIS